MDQSFLNWPFFDKRHRRLAERVGEWANEKLPPLADHGDVDGSCVRIVEALGKADFLEYAVPQDGVFDIRSLCIIRETLAYHSGLADFSFAMQGLGSGPMTLFADDAIRNDALLGIRRGTTLAAFALTEPEAGSDVAQINLRARPDGEGHYRLDGEKIWISNGGIAGHYVVFARTGEAPGAKGLSAFSVPADTPGLSIAERLHTVAPHPLARLSFRNCRIPATRLIGKPGEGFRIAMATLDVFRSTVGAAALGFARRAFRTTLDRVRRRQLFGSPMADMQLVQTAIAEMAIEIDAAALLIYRAAWTRDSGASRITREAAMAKMVATEAAQRVIDSAVQLHGGEGVRAGSVPETLYREIRALRIYEGATEVQKLIIARQILESA